MVYKLDKHETDCLLAAVHHYVMYLRNLDADACEECFTCINIEKYLLDSSEIELENGLPF